MYVEAILAMKILVECCQVLSVSGARCDSSKGLAVDSTV